MDKTAEIKIKEQEAYARIDESYQNQMAELKNREKLFEAKLVELRGIAKMLKAPNLSAKKQLKLLQRVDELGSNLRIYVSSASMYAADDVYSQCQIRRKLVKAQVKLDLIKAAVQNLKV